MERNGSISKQDLRVTYLDRRDRLSAREREEKSAAIWRRLRQEKAYRTAQTLLVYMDYRSEVLTTGPVEELLLSREKRIFAPKVEGMDIRFYEVGSMDEFFCGYQGIREPRKDPHKHFTPQMAEAADPLVLLPGVVFDRGKGRLGYGKGFYDRFLSEFSDIQSAALAFSCQITKKLPMEVHDKRPDFIVTEDEVIR